MGWGYSWGSVLEVGIAALDGVVGVEKWFILAISDILGNYELMNGLPETRRCNIMLSVQLLIMTGQPQLM